MSEAQTKQFRAALTAEEMRAINIDAASKGIDRVTWFTQAIRTSPAGQRIFPKGSKA